ncbi:hypothetical protein ACIBCD_27055 [Nocardia brasiliensis]|uniref:hypothetical protein n=1 Tax=Nocardia brasiliensis TaxID=37326 RepID=UPI00379A30DC
MTSIATSITVGTADLRQALTAVTVHASTDGELPDIARVRLTIGPDHVFVTATDRFTAALAHVSTWDHDGEPFEIVELLVDDAAKLLRIFKVHGKDDGDAPQYTLRLDVAHDEVTATDSSGFDIIGRRFRMPRLETAVTLNGVPALFERAHLGQIVLLDSASSMVVSGKMLARFKVAATVYDEPLAMETRSGHRKGSASVLIRCGESFLGLIVPRQLVDEEAARAREWAQGWTARLPELLDVSRGEGQ